LGDCCRVRVLYRLYIALAVLVGIFKRSGAVVPMSVRGYCMIVEIPCYQIESQKIWGPGLANIWGGAPGYMPFPTPDNGVRALSGFPTKLTIVRRDPYCNVEKWFRHRSTLKRESRPRYVCVSAQSRGSTGTESSVLYSVAAHIIAELSVTS